MVIKITSPFKNKSCTSWSYKRSLTVSSRGKKKRFGHCYEGSLVIQQVQLPKQQRTEYKNKRFAKLREGFKKNELGVLAQPKEGGFQRGPGAQPLLTVFQAACCLNIQLTSKKIQDTSKHGRGLKFRMLTVLTNIRSTKVL